MKTTPASSSRRLTLRRVTAPKVAKARRAPEKTVADAAPLAPIVKWAGGKAKLLPEIEARMPTVYRRYFEPFFGGGALYFRIAPRVAIINDWNRDLVNVYRCVAWNVEAVIRRLRDHEGRHGRDHYYATREAWNDRDRTWGDVDRAAAFIYLNKTCFNGLWRVNRSGGFNVPMGRYKNPPILRPERLRAAGAQLRHAEIHTGDYRDAVERAEAGDFLYFDPPYQPLTKTSNFVSYTEKNFGEDEQRNLANVARSLDARGCSVMLSNSDTPFIRKLYRGFKIEKVMCPRAINSKASSRGAVAEVLIRNYK